LVDLQRVPIGVGIRSCVLLPRRPFSPENGFTFGFFPVSYPHHKLKRGDLNRLLFGEHRLSKMLELSKLFNADTVLSFLTKPGAVGE
jgi:hypothetical protein